MPNLFREFLDLLPQRPLQVGTVAGFDAGVYTIELSGGARIHARGQDGITGRVWVRDGVIEGPAPALTYVEEEG